MHRFTEITKDKETAAPADRKRSDRAQSPVLLHPHHGLCFAFFEGKGYSGEFTDNLAKVLNELKTANPDICLTCGQDPVCSACPNDQNGVCSSREKVERYDRAVLSLCDLKEGDILSYAAFTRMVQSRILDTGRRREVCADCQWDKLCNMERDHAFSFS